MTKEITKAIILQQIQDKFKLREFEPSKFLFDETVVPVYDVHEHLSHAIIKMEEKSVTSGPVAVLFYEVPQDERWKLSAYNMIFMGAGAYTVTGLLISKFDDSYTESFYLDMELGQSTSYRVLLPTVVTLEPLDRLYVYIDSYTSTQNLRLYLYTMVEELR